MTDQQGFGPDAAGEVDLVDLHEVEVLDEERGQAARAPHVPDEVIDLDDEHVLEDVDAESDHDIDPDDIDPDGVELDADQDGGDSDVMVLDSWQIQLAATGDEQVDAALARLTEVEGLAPARHAEVYEAIHAGLKGALANLDRT